jgi:hypothetical protein
MSCAQDISLVLPSGAHDDAVAVVVALDIPDRISVRLLALEEGSFDAIATLTRSADHDLEGGTAMLLGRCHELILSIVCQADCWQAKEGPHPEKTDQAAQSFYAIARHWLVKNTGSSFQLAAFA